MQSTVAIFHYLASTAPPLVPDALIETMHQALEHFSGHSEATLEELERVMISYGFELWPYTQAFKEILLDNEHTMGEQFLLPKLPAALKSAYLNFKKSGGDVSSLRTGAAAHYFNSAERVVLCGAVVEMEKNLRDFATQQVVGPSRRHYLSRVAHYKLKLKTIQKHVDALRSLADSEDEHPVLAQEIRERITSFEQGLCMLGPELSYDTMCEAVEYFKGRKTHLNHFKHLYQPKQFIYR